MKKFLKVILIIILVGLSIGCTVYLFYRQLNPKVDYLDELHTYYSGKTEQEFNKKLDQVFSKTNSASDTRFSLIVETNGTLTSCLQSLTGYYAVAGSHNIHEKKISNELSSLKSARSAAEFKMDAYLTKTTAQGEISTGANDTYDAVSKYFVEYANFINLINSELSSMGINRDVDLKFPVIEIYCNVCIDTFSNLNTGFLHEIKSDINLSAISEKVKFKNSFLDLGNKNFSYLNNSFVEHYNKTDKAEFASNLYDNMLNGSADSSTDELLAGYYLKSILGIELV